MCPDASAVVHVTFHLRSICLCCRGLSSLIAVLLTSASLCQLGLEVICLWCLLLLLFLERAEIEVGVCIGWCFSIIYCILGLLCLLLFLECEIVE